MKKIAVGMSGGVDSALSAALLVEQGHDVTGVFLECWRAPGCRVDEDRKDAMDVALQLGIPFKVLDFKKEYKEKVVEYFFSEYKAGRTPNPDTMCNREIKFGMFYDWAMEEGFDFVATGHYSRICERGVRSPKTGVRLCLCAGIDRNKDQSYFLYQLRQEQLEHILFPLGEMTKDKVRKEAKKRQLVVANKPDSQGICFIGPVDIRKFLESRITSEVGEVVDTGGEVIGSHDGVWFYTIGQRHGFNIDGGYKSKSGKWKHTIPPLYVISKDVKNNRLVVGFGKETLTSEFKVRDVHWINKNLKLKTKNSKILVRIRHRGKKLESRITNYESGIKIELEEAQRGVAPGQAVVFYLSASTYADRQTGKGDEVLGGGVIE